MHKHNKCINIGASNIPPHKTKLLGLGFSTHAQTHTLALSHLGSAEDGDAEEVGRQGGCHTCSCVSVSASTW